ncbi:hypothetical protein ACFL57_01740 [Candidatus Margulisiibacteriota bacterium]
MKYCKKLIKSFHSRLSSPTINRTRLAEINGVLSTQLAPDCMGAEGRAREIFRKVGIGVRYTDKNSANVVFYAPHKKESEYKLRIAVPESETSFQITEVPLTWNGDYLCTALDNVNPMEKNSLGAQYQLIETSGSEKTTTPFDKYEPIQGWAAFINLESNHFLTNGKKQRPRHIRKIHTETLSELTDMLPKIFLYGNSFENKLVSEAISYQAFTFLKDKGHIEKDGRVFPLNNKMAVSLDINLIRKDLEKSGIIFGENKKNRITSIIETLQESLAAAIELDYVAIETMPAFNVHSFPEYTAKETGNKLTIEPTGKKVTYGWRYGPDARIAGSPFSPLEIKAFMQQGQSQGIQLGLDMVFSYVMYGLKASSFFDAIYGDSQWGGGFNVGHPVLRALIIETVREIADTYGPLYLRLDQTNMYQDSAGPEHNDTHFKSLLSQLSMIENVFVIGEDWRGNVVQTDICDNKKGELRFQKKPTNAIQALKYIEEEVVPMSIDLNNRQQVSGGQIEKFMQALYDWKSIVLALITHDNQGNYHFKYVSNHLLEMLLTQARTLVMTWKSNAFSYWREPQGSMENEGTISLMYDEIALFAEKCGVYSCFEEKDWAYLKTAYQAEFIELQQAWAEAMYADSLLEINGASLNVNHLSDWKTFTSYFQEKYYNNYKNQDYQNRKNAIIGATGEKKAAFHKLFLVHNNLMKKLSHDNSFLPIALAVRIAQRGQQIFRRTLPFLSSMDSIRDNYHVDHHNHIAWARRADPLYPRENNLTVAVNFGVYTAKDITIALDPGQYEITYIANDGNTRIETITIDGDNPADYRFQLQSLEGAYIRSVFNKEVDPEIYEILEGINEPKTMVSIKPAVNISTFKYIPWKVNNGARSAGSLSKFIKAGDHLNIDFHELACYEHPKGKIYLSLNNERHLCLFSEQDFPGIKIIDSNLQTTPSAGPHDPWMDDYFASERIFPESTGGNRVNALYSRNPIPQDTKIIYVHLEDGTVLPVTLGE